MDKITRLLGVIYCASTISFCVSVSYLPSTGGNIPDGIDAAEYSRQQNQIILNSLAFKIAIGSVIVVLFTTLYFILRLNSVPSEMKVSENKSKEIKSILKPSRISPNPTDTVE